MTTTAAPAPQSLSPRAIAALASGLALLCLWVYWPTLAGMAHRWGVDPQYSHGYLVPAFAAYLLWSRRACLQGVEWRFNWWGVALIGAAAAVRVGAQYVYPLSWLDAASLVPCLLGVFVLFGGRAAFRWAWPAAAFLLFMIPMPYRLETSLAHPLQRAATLCSTYVLQTCGFPAFAEGNTILLNKGRIGVVEACSGLSMLLIFFALATAMALLVKRPLLDRLVILVSAAPIAVIANVCRITATGTAQEFFGPEAAHQIFHEWAGWLMMPLALALLGVELWLLARLLPEVKVSTGPALGLGRPTPRTSAPGRAPAAKQGRARRGPASPILHHG